MLSQKKYMSYDSQKQYDHKIKEYIEDQISDAMLEAGSGSVDINFDISNESVPNPVNADTLGGVPASQYIKVSELESYLRNLGVIE